ncbi:MAG TPA: molybdopterin-dependent oxidoreductase, partial [Anaerolineales bacterium]
FQSVTGYAHILPMAEAGQVLLATHVGEEVLEHAHGFPLRAVVPTRRGWFWVKWLERIEVIAI